MSFRDSIVILFMKTWTKKFYYGHSNDFFIRTHFFVFVKNGYLLYAGADLKVPENLPYYIGLVSDDNMLPDKIKSSYKVSIYIIN